MRWRQYRIKRREKLDRERNAYHSSYFGQQQKDSIGSSPSSSKIKIRPWYHIPNMSIVPWITVSIGVFFVIFLSPALANYSLFEIPLALSLSLTSITPLFTIPLGIFWKGDRPTLRGYFGAGLSVLGVMILCIWGVDSSL